MHARTQIRNAFVSALETIPGVWVYNGRIFPLNNQVLPALSVFSRQELIPDDNDAGRLIKQQHRSTIVSVVGYAKTSPGPGSQPPLLDDDLDDLAELTEVAIFNDETVVNMVRCLDLIATTIDVDQSGEKAIGTITMDFQCRYITEDGQPGVIS